MAGGPGPFRGRRFRQEDLGTNGPGLCDDFVRQLPRAGNPGVESLLGLLPFPRRREEGMMAEIKQALGDLEERVLAAVADYQRALYHEFVAARVG